MTLDTLFGEYGWVWHNLTDSLNPALMVLIVSEIPQALSSTVAAPPAERRAALARAARFCLIAVVAVAVPVFLAEKGKAYQVWHGHPGFPSGHTTFSTAAGAAIAAHRGRWWLVLLVPITVLMMVALVKMHNHTPIEVMGGALLGGVLGTVISRLLRPRPAPASPPP